MIGKQGALDESNQPEQQGSNPADADVWSQLGELASSEKSDPVLRLLVSEAVSRYEELRGITATIATRYRGLVDAVPDAIIIHDQTGDVLDANEAACRIYRKSRDSILQSSLAGLNPGMDVEFLASLHHAQRNDRSLTAHSTIVHEDGSRSALELHARAYLDAGRIRFIAVIRDLGPREDSEQQLRDSDTWLRRVLHDVDKGVVFLNRRGKILSANPAACRALQMSEAELCALASDQLERWRYVDACGHRLEASTLPWTCALGNGKPHESMVCGIKLPDRASTLWLSVSAIPHADEKVAVLFNDISSLQHDAMMFAELQSLSNLGTWQLDLERESLLCSAQMHKILDVPLFTPLTRQRMLEHFSGADLERFRQALAAARDGNPDQFDALMMTSIGRKRRVRIRVRPLQTESHTRAIFGVLKDITADSPLETAT